MIRSILNSLTISVAMAFCLPSAMASTPLDPMPLTRTDQPAARIVLLGEADVLMTNAADVITTTVRAWSGVELQVERLAAKSGALPDSSVIVLARFADYRAADPSPETTSTLLLRVQFVGDEGFACIPQMAKGKPRLLVLANTSKGVLNGAYYVRDFLIDGMKDNLKLKLAEVLRAPQMGARGTYALSMYGVTPRYTVEDWKPIMRSFARDGMNRVYFWVSGMFPSKNFPQTFDRDASTGTKIREIAQIRALIEEAHAQGLKFYLGSGTFAWSTAHYLGEGVPDSAAVGAGGLNPSNAEVRRRHIEYFMEIVDALPEADGLFLEVRDEHGECQCPACQVKLDEYGSKMYGEALISFIQQLADQVWRKHPKMRFCVNVGYKEHENDVNYYEQIGRMRDERFEWLDCRWAWQFPGPKGEKLPASYFTRKAIHWGAFYSRPLKDMIEMTTRATREGYYGYCPAFEPGFATADFFGNEVPYPVDRLPYALTGFVYRELTWEHAEAVMSLEQRVQRRFFGAEVPEGMGQAVMELRDMVIAAESHPNVRAITSYSQDRSNYSAQLVPHASLAGEMERIGGAPASDPARTPAAKQLLVNVRMLIKVKEEMLPKMEALQQRIEKARGGASPKSLQTFDQMQHLIDDTRRHYAIAVPDPAKLTEYAERLEGGLQ